MQRENGIPLRFARRIGGDPRTGERILAGRERGEAWAFLYGPDGMPASEPAPEWADRRIVVADGGLAYIDLLTDSMGDVENNYDPVLYYTEDRAGLLNMPDDVTVEQSWHPGWVDYFVYRLGERANRPRARQFTVARCQDVAALCDPRLADWVREKRIELVNFRDALYGSSEYQAHLKEIGTVVYLKVPLKELERRIQNFATRGIQMEEGQTLADLYAERIPLYEQYADVTVATGAGGLQRNAEKIIQALGDFA